MKRLGLSQSYYSRVRLGKQGSLGYLQWEQKDTKIYSKFHYISLSLLLIISLLQQTPNWSPCFHSCSCAIQPSHSNLPLQIWRRVKEEEQGKPLNVPGSVLSTVPYLLLQLNSHPSGNCQLYISLAHFAPSNFKVIPTLGL